MRFQNPKTKRSSSYDSAVNNGAVLIGQLVGNQLTFAQYGKFTVHPIWTHELERLSKENPSSMMVAVQLICSVIQETSWVLPGYGASLG